MRETISKRKFISEEEKNKIREVSDDKRLTRKAKQLNAMVKNSGPFSEPVINLVNRDEETRKLFVAKLLEDEKNLDKNLKRLAEALGKKK
tara:strand:- start:7428 stop:7697 length:270 start_codon:yes stop_codon:yes gene_type:complete